MVRGWSYLEAASSVSHGMAEAIQRLLFTEATDWSQYMTSPYGLGFSLHTTAVLKENVPRRSIWSVDRQSRTGVVSLNLMSSALQTQNSWDDLNS